jgi:hypothetical protein
MIRLVGCAVSTYCSIFSVVFLYSGEEPLYQVSEGPCHDEDKQDDEQVRQGTYNGRRNVSSPETT